MGLGYGTTVTLVRIRGVADHLADTPPEFRFQSAAGPMVE
jgi:hypothetical protein